MKKVCFTAERALIPCFLNGTDKGHDGGEIVSAGHGSHTAVDFSLDFRHTEALFGSVVRERRAEILKKEERLVPMFRQTVNTAIPLIPLRTDTRYWQSRFRN